MSKLRTTLSTSLATLAIGSVSLVGSPTAHAQAPIQNPEPAPASSQTTSRTLSASSSNSSSSKTSGLTFGARSEAVRSLQAKLTRAGHYVPQTGYFGTMTQQALRDFQASEDMIVTGRATARTLSALGGVSGSSITSTSSERTARSAVTSSVSNTRQAASSAGAQAAVDFAYGAIGTPYVYGGTTAAGYDCSGLTQAAWAAAGVSIPRTSYAQWSGLQSVSTSNLQPGDIVVFYGGSHVGLYVGDGQVIHSSRPGQPVSKVSMSTMPVSGAVRPA